MTTPIRPRTQARLLAVQALCLFDAIGDGFEADLGTFLHDSVAHVDLGLQVPIPPDVPRFARRLVEGARAERAQRDAQIQEVATGWRLGRMSPVDRNILRLGLYELLHTPETAPEVIINEAIEIARYLGNEDSPRFVNGVLDALRQKLLPQQSGGVQSEPRP